MVQFSKKTAVLLAFTALAQGAPIYKRIAQTIADSTKQWEQACLAAGGADQCNPISIKAFSTLLAAAGDCDQQNAADDMVDLAKQLNNDADMIKFAQIFAQQPRNSPTAQSVPYCQQAPKNAELNGLFQCQFQGADPKTFVGGVAVGGQGTIPFGQNAPLDPPGSCPANPQGPIPDGQQLVDITQDPGVGGAAGAAGAAGNGTDASTSGGVTVTASAVSSSVTASATDNADANSVNSPTSGAAAGNNKKRARGTDGTAVNGKDGISIGGGSANGGNAVAGKGGNGADGQDAVGGDGGLNTNGQDAVGADGQNGTSGNAAGDFQLQNGQDAQKLNAQFATLTAGSPCNDGDNACIDGAFSQCVNGMFQPGTQCAGGTQCVALPLVNKPGTSVACTTQADAEARIAATGAQGGLTGSGN